MRIVKTKLGERAFLFESHDSNDIVMALREKADLDRERAKAIGLEGTRLSDDDQVAASARLVQAFLLQADRAMMLADAIEEAE